MQYVQPAGNMYILWHFAALTYVHAYDLQVTDAVWVSMLMSALAGILAVCLMIATFYCIRYCLPVETTGNVELLLWLQLPSLDSAQHFIHCSSCIQCHVD